MRGTTTMNYEQKGTALRKDILKMLCAAHSGHSGGSLSCVEILMGLYYGVMKVDPQNPRMGDRDRFSMSKGHGCPTLYAILADLGFFPRKELWTLRKIDSRLQGHPDMHKVPGVDISTGSLGQGAANAMGMALAAKYMGKDYKVYTLLGDGECQEGIVWETAMAAAHYKLDNFVMILDHNGLQIDGTNDEVMGLGDICGKFSSFGFDCASVDGHDVYAIIEALKRPSSGKPKFIECRTIKGKGVSFMENEVGWHGRPPSEAELEQALMELEGKKHG
ncbi:transketolase [Anaerotruncus rubiinfantis]|uniref:transketolase n=1 Tax=Anaerotruncus rubiinfantis TaxID=1720200 RepID=UPI00241C1237|nr:transketolase [Anaerotruncus rubiinfantis]